MDDAKIPFNFFDFFGYLIPGLIFTIAIIWVLKPKDTYQEIFDFLISTKDLIYIVSFLIIIIIYSLGHIVSSLGSYFFESLLVGKLLGYPSNNLFAGKEKNTWPFSSYGKNYSKEFRNSFNEKFKEHFGDLFLFSWDEITGSNNEKLIEFLEQNFHIDGAKIKKIENIDDGKTIQVSTAKNLISLKLNNEKTKVRLKIDDYRTDEFNVKAKNGNLNIYGDFNISDKYMLCFTFVKEKCPVALGRLTIFISLYDFARNSAMALLILALVFIYNGYILYAEILFVLTLIFISRYLKFFRIFGDEVFRTFYIFKDQNS